LTPLSTEQYRYIVLPQFVVAPDGAVVASRNDIQAYERLKTDIEVTRTKRCAHRSQVPSPQRTFGLTLLRQTLRSTPTRPLNELGGLLAQPVHRENDGRRIMNVPAVVRDWVLIPVCIDLVDEPVSFVSLNLPVFQDARRRIAPAPRSALLTRLCMPAGRRSRQSSLIGRRDWARLAQGHRRPLRPSPALR